MTLYMRKQQQKNENKKDHKCTIKKNGLDGKRKAVERFVKNGISTHTKNNNKIQHESEQQKQFAL